MQIRLTVYDQDGEPFVIPAAASAAAHATAPGDSIPERSGSFNPVSALGSEPDFVINLLVQMADVPMDKATTALAKTVALEQAAKGGEVTLRQLVDSLDARPQLQHFASALRKNALPGAHAARFTNPLS